jgi:2-methylisocitrate lyase-like PEP mutase family enzyme
MSYSTPAARLRALLRHDRLVIAPGVFDGLTAKLAERAGFDVLYMTGAGTSAAHGYPDYGLLTLTEMADNAGLIAEAVGLPLIADADTGYGNELNVTRAVREYERRGVAAIHIEDQIAPKRCGHLTGKEVVPREDFVAKISAAVAARRDPDFVVIARTDSRAVIGFEEAVTRANMVLAAGADLAFVEAAETKEELAAIPARVGGPCLLNVVPGGRTPAIGKEEAAALGYRIAIYPALSLFATVSAVEGALEQLKSSDMPPQWPVDVLGDFYRRLGSESWDAIRTRFDKGGSHV